MHLLSTAAMTSAESSTQARLPLSASRGHPHLIDSSKTNSALRGDSSGATGIPIFNLVHFQKVMPLQMRRRLLSEVLVKTVKWLFQIKTWLKWENPYQKLYKFQTGCPSETAESTDFRKTSSAKTTHWSLIEDSTRKAEFTQFAVSLACYWLLVCRSSHFKWR